MGSWSGKQKQNDNESNPRKQRHTFGFSTASKGEMNRRLLNTSTKQNESPSSTRLYDLPLEMLDNILQKSFLYLILNSSTKQRDEEVIRSLISVDDCCNRIITRRRFKRAIWRYLRDVYGKTKKINAIIRSNRNYLVDNIQPNDELIASLLSLNCITEEDSHLIRRQRSIGEKNYELLRIMECTDETTFSNVVKCLRHTNQKTVAKIIENGGGVIKIQLPTPPAKCATSMETKLFLLHQEIQNLRNKTNSRSHLITDKLVVQLREEGIDILGSQLDRQTVIVWIWCRTQEALEHIQMLHESNQLRRVFFEGIQPTISEVIDIDRDQFKKTVVVRQISISFTERIDIQGNRVRGVTKLRNSIYILCLSGNVIQVFDDRTPFSLQKEIEIKEIKTPGDIFSNETENCLYVCDHREYCIFKITKERDNHHKIIKWLTTDYPLITVSVSSDGQLLMIRHSSNSLMIYGSDAELIRSIPLPGNIICPHHAVQTSIGNYVVIHTQEKEVVEVEDSVIKEWKRKDWLERSEGGEESNGGRKDMVLVVSELNRNGQMVIRRFIATNEPRHVFDYYLSVHSDDRVFVADTGNDRMILLNSDLRCYRVLCLTKDERRVRRPQRLCYDEEMKQVIVGKFLGSEVNVYTLSRS